MDFGFPMLTISDKLPVLFCLAAWQTLTFDIVGQAVSERSLLINLN